MKNSVARIIYYSILVSLLLIALIVGLLLYTLQGKNILNAPSAATQTPEFAAVSTAPNVDSEPLPAYHSQYAQYAQCLDIDWTSGTITLEFADTKNMIFTENEPELAMTHKMDLDTLILRYPQDSAGTFQNHPSKDLHILVPKEWGFRKLVLNTTSASLIVRNGTIGEVEISSTSGTSHFENCALEQLSVDTISGTVVFDGTVQSFACNSTSASAKLDIYNCPDSIEMDTISGSMTLHLPSDCGFTAEHDSISGSFDSDFSTTTRGGKHTHGDGGCAIKFDGTSGSLTIRDRGEDARRETHHN